MTTAPAVTRVSSVRCDFFDTEGQRARMRIDCPDWRSAMRMASRNQLIDGKRHKVFKEDSHWVAVITLKVYMQVGAKRKGWSP